MTVDMEKMKQATRENRLTMIRELAEYHLVPKDVFEWRAQSNLNRLYKKMLREKAIEEQSK